MVSKSNENILFSIIIPVYNVEHYLEQCLDSILCQSYSAFEIILVNDGSTDSSLKICIQYETKDARISIINKANGGLSDARNVGLLIAKGDYVLFTDSDDYWVGKQVLEDLNFLIKKSNPDVIIHEESRFFSKNNIKNKFNQQYLNVTYGDFKKESEALVYYDLFAACAWDKVIRRVILIENDLFFPLGRKSEDMEWCSRLMMHLKTFVVYPTSFYTYRQARSGSITQNISEQHIMDVYEMIKQGLRKTKADGSSLDNALINFWAANYVILLKDFYILSSNNRKAIWNELLSWKYLLTKGRNIKLDKVMQFYRFIPFKILPNLLYVFRILNELKKKYKTIS
ncbi:glycosyltransferase involved in cell wall biosynthesis [Flavobacterium sp. 28A]|uniref:glycosyltransferase family 2 protein n=1 Tax=Flavobacterium sp. 28A TaxID=2735895 RepID=UPI0015707D60|nr:glycosyltransferase family 2 protein [Flavobacterium sp. 28A]NRT14445.1 glycosyltransferase involved in cell wall biosynthesis [Flavobacterium sp. 28A]